MSKETPKPKSSSKNSDRGALEGVQSTRSVGRFDDPSSVTSLEQTCNIENFWRAIFCFGGPPLPDADLPRDFKEFRTDGSQRINSFTMATSKSDEIEITEFHGGNLLSASKKVEDPEVIARKQKEMDELRSILNHNTEERLKEQSIDEDLLEAQRQAAETEALMAARKQQMLEMKQASQRLAADGTRPRGFSASLPPQSPRVLPSPRVGATPRLSLASTGSAGSPMAGGSVVGIASGPSSGHSSVASTPRNMDQSIDNASLIRSTFSKSHSGGVRTGATKAAVPHSPYASSVASSHFSQLSPATTGDSVDVVDISNFTRFAATDGVNCLFYLPSREGDAKPKPARFHCDPTSTKFRLDILAASSSPSTPLHGGAEVVVKSLSFDTAHDILALTKGRGPVVRMPAELPDDLLLHITLHNKPEINLSFSDVTSRDVVYNALPGLLASSATSSKKHHHHHHHHGKADSPAHHNLIGLSMSVTKLTSIYWVEVPAKSVYSNRFTTKLLITRSDDSLALYSVPREYEFAGSSTPHSATAATAAKAAEVDAKRRALNDQLAVFTHSRWNPDSLPNGFDIMLEIAFSEIKKVSHVGENEQDHVIEISYQKEKKEETEVLVRLESSAKRKALIVFLEDKRKHCKKHSHHHELL